MTQKIILLSLMLLLAAYTHASSASPPILQLNPGGHKAIIRDIAFTPDGNYLVSASDDKTIRVWDLDHPGQARILRGQIGAGHEGKIFAMALAPDGRTLAVGGWLDKDRDIRHSIRLQNLATGRIFGLLRGHTNVVLSLAFSPDGGYLVSGSFDKTARIWDLQQQRLLHTLNGHTDAIYAVAFTPDGQRVVTGSDDHDLRLWSVTTGQLIARMSDSDKVRAVAVAPDGTIASGSWNHTISLWNGRTGAFIKQLADQGTQVGSLSFSPDGRQLLSGITGPGDNDCHLWSVPDGRQLQRYTGHDNIVLATAFAPNGRLVATAGGNQLQIDLWDPRTGKLQHRLAGGGGAVWAVGISNDGNRLAWGHQGHPGGNSLSALEYQLPIAPELGSPSSLGQTNINWQRAVANLGAWSLQHRKGGNYGYDAILEILQNDQVQARIERDSTDGLQHRSYSFTPDGQTIISGGSNGVLTAYDRQGQKLGDFVGHTGDIWAVAVASDGKLLVSGSNDQTVRLWNIATRELLLTIFRHKDGEWVAWTPSGYYAASPNGDNMIGWQVNRGPEYAPDYYPAGQFKQSRYQPDLVTKVIQLGSEQKALAAWQRRHKKAETLTIAMANLPATPRLLNDIQDTVTTAQQRLVFAVDQNTRHLIVTVNGRPTRGINTGSNTERTITQTITLSPGINQIQAIARNKTGESTPVNWTVNYQVPNWRKPTLYLLAIGISSYADSSINLRYANIDAQTIVERLRQETGDKLYQQVKVKIVTDKAATRMGILDALSFLNEMTQDDLALLFIAGHGVTDSRNTFYFLPHDGNHKRLFTTAIRWTDIQYHLQGLPGKVLLWTDTCHAAGIAGGSTKLAARNINTISLVREFADADTGVLIFASSTGAEKSLEGQHWGHGAFTKALLDGLSGQADYDHDGIIHRSELETYVKRKVAKITRGRQHPITAGTAVADFAIATVP
ncbi:hypothetical protein TI05_03575 [Achromatium sp. WMS3]|nr:hypothetical protein TI05_03575 [Achromatium sp. WMS3]